MQISRLALVLLPSLVGASDNPLGKVIQLMDSLSAKITKEGEDEAKAYAEFVEWCDDASKNKNFAIETGTSKKGKLEAEIAKSSDDSQTSASKVEDLAARVATSEKELKAASEIRAKEASDFTSGEAELMDVIDKLGRAVAILEREMSKNPASFAQLDTSSIDGLIKTLGTVMDAAAFSTVDRQQLAALLQSRQSGEDEDGLGAPDPATYKTHSNNILDVLEDLKEKAEEQLSALRKAESNGKHNFNLLKQSLEDQIAADNKDMGEEKAAKAAADEANAEATSDLAMTERKLADDRAALATANSNCMQTAADHEATIKARTEELAVIAQAKQILTASTAGAVTQTYSFVQTGSQLRTRADLANAEIVAMVKKLAQDQHSAALAQLASRVSAVIRYGTSVGEDPFAKVKGLIQDMIAKLENEAHSQATEKAYCDEQIAKTEAKRDDLQSDSAKLKAKIDMAAAKSAGLKEDVKELQTELSALAKTQAEMDRIRQDSHAAYAQAKEDLQSGLAGVRKALSLLREYYDNSAASAMIQDSAEQPAPPEKHEKSAGAGSSIIGVLEVCESDFARNLASEETEESDAQAEYEKVTQENAVTRTLKDQDVAYKTQSSKSLDQTIAEFSADREGVTSELAAVLEYYSKIRDRCIAKPETYEERARRRTAEIAGLKEALRVLESETALVQHRKRGSRGHFLGM